MNIENPPDTRAFADITTEPSCQAGAARTWCNPASLCATLWCCLRPLLLAGRVSVARHPGKSKASPKSNIDFNPTESTNYGFYQKTKHPLCAALHYRPGLLCLHGAAGVVPFALKLVF